jgi:N-acetylmuramoyl-L-alanine amidase
MQVAEPESPVAARFVPSPNHGERNGGRAPDCVLLHYTGMPTSAVALRWLCDPASSVSCHYYVEEDGEVLQLVSESRRAWHAGVSCWAGDRDLNSSSIGIEIVNAGHPGGLPPYPDVQISAVIALCRDLCARRAIPPERILAHSDVAPGRKIDPGEVFPWETLYRGGVGLWVPPMPADDGPTLAPGDTGTAVAAVQRQLASYGYDVLATGDYDAATERVVAAFQRRFRPARVDGRADPSTRATLGALISLAAG